MWCQITHTPIVVTIIKGMYLCWFNKLFIKCCLYEYKQYYYYYYYNSSNIACPFFISFIWFSRYHCSYNIDVMKTLNENQFFIVSYKKRKNIFI